MGLISVSGGLISGTIGLKPDHVDLKSDLGGLKSGRTEIPILLGVETKKLEQKQRV